MQKYLNEIDNFKKFSNKINCNIAIIGSGRWAKIIISEIKKNFSNIKKIFVITNYQNQIEKWNKKKNINNLIISNNYRNLKKHQVNFTIIVNKNKDHYKVCKKILNLNCNALVEKPLIANLEKINSLVKFSVKKKLFIIIGMQFFFSYFFYHVKQQKIKKKIVKELEFKWFDKNNEKRHGKTKHHDPNINYLEDIFYHIYSIIYIFLGEGKINIENKYYFSTKSNSVIFFYNNCKINLNYSKKSNFRKRNLKIKLSNNESIDINFSNYKKIYIKKNNKKYQIQKKLCQGALKYELLNYFSLSNYRKEKKINDIRKLNNFFKNLDIIKNIR